MHGFVCTFLRFGLQCGDWGASGIFVLRLFVRVSLHFLAGVTVAVSRGVWRLRLCAVLLAILFDFVCDFPPCSLRFCAVLFAVLCGFALRFCAILSAIFCRVVCGFACEFVQFSAVLFAVLRGFVCCFVRVRLRFPSVSDAVCLRFSCSSLP